MMTRKIQAKLGAVTKAMILAKIILSGARRTMRRIIMKENWMFDLSVVLRVTIEEVENLSMFLKE